MIVKPSRDVVAIIVAAGLATAVNCITFAVLYDAIRSDTPGLSDNATQVLTGSLGGMIGLLGAYLGFQAGDRHRRERDEHAHDDSPDGSESTLEGPERRDRL